MSPAIMTVSWRLALLKTLSLLLVIVLFIEIVTPASVAFAQPATAKQPAAGKPQDLIARGQQQFEDQQYEESIQTLSGALLKPSNTPQQKVEIYRLLALNYITIGRKDEADNAVRGLLVAQPDYQLPPNESPRFRDFFAQARTKWEAEGRPGLVKDQPTQKPVVLRHGSPTSAQKDKTIELHGKLEDPEGRTGSVKLYYRAGSQGDFSDVMAEVDGDSIRASIPGSAVKPPVMDYYLEVLDGGGAVIATRGDAQSPLRIPVPDGSGGWVLPIAIGGGILGAAAIVGILALAGVFKSSSGGSSSSSGGTSGAPQNPSHVTINVGESGIRF